MKRFLIILLASVFVGVAQAQTQECKAPHECAPQVDQRRHERKHGERPKFSPEEFKKYLEDFVSRECCLTPQEKEKFFPLLHEMMHKQRQIRKQQMELFKQQEDLTEKDYEEIVTKCTALEVEDKKIEQTYYKKFHSVLTWKKVSKVRVALYKFQMEALRNFQPRGKR